eukprot:GCRY01003469.1.p1 GENE.GCRY01003469.1~~GCRY01003469.1.p1  ORF type:complete len:300 (-),score=36.88 GCRY01003469.1:333-1232(-)
MGAQQVYVDVWFGLFFASFLVSTFSFLSTLLRLSFKWTLRCTAYSLLMLFTLSRALEFCLRMLDKWVDQPSQNEVLFGLHSLVFLLPWAFLLSCFVVILTFWVKIINCVPTMIPLLPGDRVRWLSIVTNSVFYYVVVFISFFAAVFSSQRVKLIAIGNLTLAGVQFSVLISSVLVCLRLYGMASSLSRMAINESQFSSSLWKGIQFATVCVFLSATSLFANATFLTTDAIYLFRNDEFPSGSFAYTHSFPFLHFYRLTELLPAWVLLVLCWRPLVHGVYAPLSPSNPTKSVREKTRRGK